MEVEGEESGMAMDWKDIKISKDPYYCPAQEGFTTHMTPGF